MTSAVELLSDDILHGMLTESPDLAQSLGIERIGERTLERDTLPDYSETAVARRAQLVRDWSLKLRALPALSDNAADSITCGTIDYVLHSGFQHRFSSISGSRYVDHIEPVTHISGVHATAVEMLAHQHAPQNRAHAERYLARLERLPLALRQATETLQARRQRGFVAPVVILERAIADIRSSMAASGRDHLFLRPLIEGIGRNDPEGAGVFIALAEGLLRDRILPGYAGLLEELDRHVAVNRLDISSSARPRGADFYLWRFQGHTTTSMTPDSAHSIALGELQRLRESLREEFERFGFRGTVDEGLARWTTEDKAIPGDDGRKEILERLSAVVLNTKTLMRPLFNLWPEADVVVEPLPPEQERSQHSYYIPPTSGEARPGIFWLNCQQMSVQPRSEATMVCYHEAWPGHHLQLTLAQELQLPAFRRAVLFNAYLEGWAKYAEGLPESVGIMNGRFDRVARLRTELYSTATLALDTGIHTRRWTSEEAVAFFIRETGAEPGLANMVVMRSIANPAQLCAYKIGLMKVRELRATFEKARGTHYRLPDFHDAFLGQGALPLDLAERTMRAQGTIAA